MAQKVEHLKSSKRLKTFKRKADVQNPTRDQVTPVRIPLANRFATLVGREVTFTADEEFGLTLTPIAKRKKGAKYVKKGKKATKIWKKGWKRKEKQDENSENSAKRLDQKDSPKEQRVKNRVVGFDRENTLNYFKIECFFCKKDISQEQDHLLKKCKKVKEGNLRKIFHRRTKTAKKRVQEIGEAIDTRD